MRNSPEITQLNLSERYRRQDYAEFANLFGRERGYVDEFELPSNIVFPESFQAVTSAMTAHWKKHPDSESGFPLTRDGKIAASEDIELAGNNLGQMLVRPNTDGMYGFVHAHPSEHCAFSSNDLYAFAGKFQEPLIPDSLDGLISRVSAGRQDRLQVLGVTSANEVELIVKTSQSIKLKAADYVGVKMELKELGVFDVGKEYDYYNYGNARVGGEFKPYKMTKDGRVWISDEEAAELDMRYTGDVARLMGWKRYRGKLSKNTELTML